MINTDATLNPAVHIKVLPYPGQNVEDGVVSKPFALAQNALHTLSEGLQRCRTHPVGHQTVYARICRIRRAGARLLDAQLCRVS